MNLMTYRAGTLITTLLVVLGFAAVIWVVPQMSRLYIAAGLLLFACGCYGAGYLRGFVDAGYRIRDELTQPRR